MSFNILTIYVYLRAFNDIKYLTIKQSNYFRTKLNTMKEP